MVTLRDLAKTICNLTVPATGWKAHFTNIQCLGWGRNDQTGPSCPLEIITSTTLILCPRKFHATNFCCHFPENQQLLYFYQFLVSSLMLTSWVLWEQAECHETNGGIPTSHWKCVTILPHPHSFSWDITHKPLENTGSTTPNSLPCLWKKKHEN